MCECVFVCVCLCVCMYISASVTLKAKQQTDSNGERSSIFQMPCDHRAVRISPPSWSPAGSWGQSIQAVTWDLPGLRRQRPDSNQQACLKDSHHTGTHGHMRTCFCPRKIKYSSTRFIEWCMLLLAKEGKVLHEEWKKNSPFYLRKKNSPIPYVFRPQEWMKRCQDVFRQSHTAESVFAEHEIHVLFLKRANSFLMLRNLNRQAYLLQWNCKLHNFTTNVSHYQIFSLL